ncbi:MAG: phage tail protein [Methylotenera sp.]|nr:phage tail protein [Methylotenera sp.]
MISFNTIPTALRYPGAYIEIDGSQAGLGEDIPGVLLVGLKDAGGTAPAGEIVRIASVADAVAKAGAGSMLAQMAEAYRKVDKVLDLYMLPYSLLVANNLATGSITVSKINSEAGTLALYIDGKLVNISLDINQTNAAVANAIALAINTDTAVNIVATAVLSEVQLTSKMPGLISNNIDIRLGVYGEALPAGLELIIAGMSGGSGAPVMGDLTTIIGQKWFKYVALGLNDAATLAAWNTESKLRYAPPVQAGFRVFTAMRGDYATAAAFGETKNYEHISMLSLGLNPTTPWEAAAIVCAAAAPKLYNNPVESLEGIALPGMIGLSYHDWTQANSLLFKGMSIMQIAKDGSCSIKRLISMYQFRPDGSTDDAYLDINAAEVMERIRYEQRIGAIKRFVGTAAAKTNEGYRPGLRITTVDDVRAYLLSTYKHWLMQEKGWVQDYEFYKTNLVVEQDATNPSRFNYLDTPVILSPFYVLAGRAQFRKTAVL